MSGRPATAAEFFFSPLPFWGMVQRHMESKEQLARLETIAKEMRVRVSYEPMAGLVQGIGGLCRVQGEWRIIVDRRMQAPERVQVVADALARFEGPTRAAIDEVMAAPAA